MAYQRREGMNEPLLNATSVNDNDNNNGSYNNINNAMRIEGDPNPPPLKRQISQTWHKLKMSMVALVVVSFLALGCLIYGCVLVARASNLSIQLSSSLNTVIESFQLEGYEPFQQTNFSMSFGNVSHPLSDISDPFQNVVLNNQNTPYNSSVFVSTDVSFLPGIPPSFFCNNSNNYNNGNNTNNENNANSEDANNIINNNVNDTLSFMVSYCVGEDENDECASSGTFQVTAQFYKIVNDDCSLKNGKQECDAKGGYFDSTNQNCATFFIASQICIKVQNTSRGWRLDEGNGGIGCEYPFSSPTAFVQRPYTSNVTEFFQNSSFVFMIRSSSDPYIELQSLTKGKLSIHNFVSNTNNTGVRLVILGVIIIAASLSVAAVLFFIKRKVKREYRNAVRIPHHYSRPPLFRYLGLSLVSFGICIGVGFPLLAHWSEIAAWTYTPFFGLILVIYTGPVGMISLLIFWQLLLKTPQWSVKMRGMIGGAVGAGVMVLVSFAIAILMKPWRFVYSTDSNAPDQLQVFFGIVVSLTFFPLATLLLVICGQIFFKDNTPETDHTKTMIASGVITHRATPGFAFGVLGLFILSVVFLATSFLPPIWNVQTVGVYNTFVSPYSVLPANNSSIAVIKLYLDVVVFYGFVAGFVLIAFLTFISRPVHKIINHWIRLRVGNLFTLHSSVGEILFIFSVITLSVWWFWWWYAGYGRIAQITDTLERLARVLGHMCNLFAALLLFPVTRNSIWVEIVGIPFERAVKYHRWAGVVVFVALTGHMLVWWINWSINDTLIHNIFSVQNNPHADNWSIPMVELTWLGAAVMVLLSQNYFRRRRFELFYYTHHFFVVFFITGLIHAWSMWYFTGGGMILWFIDRLIRFYKSSKSFPVTDIQVHNNGDTTQITLQPNGFPFRAGQYAFINIPAISPLEWHPFTISSAPGETGLTFHIKNMGKTTWTSRLSRIYAHTEDSSPIINLPIINVDGPYGNPPDFSKHSNIVLVAGGIGITPMISILKDLHQLNRQNDPKHKHIKNIYLIWVVRDTAILEMFRDVFDEICSDHLCTDLFHIQLRVTQRSFSKSTDSAPFNPTPILGRPNIHQEFTEIAKLCGKEVLAMVCGPEPMINEVQTASFNNGFELHTETFEL